MVFLTMFHLLQVQLDNQALLDDQVLVDQLENQDLRVKVETWAQQVQADHLDHEAELGPLVREDRLGEQDHQVPQVQEENLDHGARQEPLELMEVLVKKA